MAVRCVPSTVTHVLGTRVFVSKFSANIAAFLLKQASVCLARISFLRRRSFPSEYSVLNKIPSPPGDVERSEIDHGFKGAHNLTLLKGAHNLTLFKGANNLTLLKGAHNLTLLKGTHNLTLFHQAV
jgi:hypothetical protein